MEHEKTNEQIETEALDRMFALYGVEGGYDISQEWNILTHDERLWAIEDREKEILETLKPIKKESRTRRYAGLVRALRDGSCPRSSVVPFETYYMEVEIGGAVCRCYTDAAHKMKEGLWYDITCRVNEDLKTVSHVKFI